MEFTLSSEAQGSRNVIFAEQKAPPISLASLRRKATPLCAFEFLQCQFARESERAL
jgi:hypothetical protein